MNQHEYQLYETLASLFPEEQGWVLLPQVRSSTGAARVRIADAIAMQTWPSRGLNLHGFEFKRYKLDWKRELNSPSKAESVARYCHFWWVVAPQGLIDPGEVPDAWGLIEFADSTMTKTKQPVSSEAEPLTYTFLAGILRQVASYEAPAAKVKAARDEGYEQGYEEGKALIENRLSLRLDSANRLEQRVKNFYNKTGIDISANEIGRIGDAVNMVLNGGLFQMNMELEQIRQKAERVIKAVDHTKDGLPER